MEKNKLKVFALSGIEYLASELNEELNKAMKTTDENYLVDYDGVWYPDGTHKIMINESVRGADAYFITDPYNRSCTYELAGKEQIISPILHVAELEHAILAAQNNQSRTNIFETSLYGARQDDRYGRESLTLANHLQLLVGRYGASFVGTFRAHNPSAARNAIPMASFEDFKATRLLLREVNKSIKQNYPKMKAVNLTSIAPDFGALKTAKGVAAAIGTERVGSFDKYRNHKKFDGVRNVVEQHRYIGHDRDLRNKIGIVDDDEISTGGSMLEVAEQATKKGTIANYIMTTHGRFVKGLDIFQKAHEKGYFKELVVTNATHIDPAAVKEYEWLKVANVVPLLAKIVVAHHKDESLSRYMNGNDYVK